MKVKDLIKALDGVDPEADVILNYSAGDEVWIVSDAEKGYFAAPSSDPYHGGHCEFAIGVSILEDEDDLTDLSPAFVLYAG